jgi:hypothetical protein
MSTPSTATISSAFDGLVALELHDHHGRGIDRGISLGGRKRAVLQVGQGPALERSPSGGYFAALT